MMFVTEPGHAETVKVNNGRDWMPRGATFAQNQHPGVLLPGEFLLLTA